MPYEIQHRKIIESIEVKLVFRKYYGKTLVVDQAVDAKYVEGQILVRMRPTFAIPLFADDIRIAIGVEQESLVGRWQDVSEYLASYFGRYAE